MTLFDERPGIEKVEEWIELADAREIELSMSVVNWGEVYYSIWHEYSRSSADEVTQQMMRLPIEIVDANLEITTLAASLKAETRLPYADCFAAALSKLRDAALATADADFEKVSDQIVLLKLP
jgi:predicted nucleic acid-binding protein